VRGELCWCALVLGRGQRTADRRSTTASVEAQGEDGGLVQARYLLEYSVRMLDGDEESRATRKPRLVPVNR